MNNMSNEKYTKKNISKEWLCTNKFKYNRLLSDEENNVYTYRFPVYKYGDFVSLECEFSVFFETGEVRINVFDYNTRSRYAPFYYIENGIYNEILDKINDRIIIQLNKFDIRQEKKDGNKIKEIKCKCSNT